MIIYHQSEHNHWKISVQSRLDSELLHLILAAMNWDNEERSIRNRVNLDSQYSAHTNNWALSYKNGNNNPGVFE